MVGSRNGARRADRIRRKIDAGVPRNQIATDEGVHPDTVRRIERGQCWAIVVDGKTACTAQQPSEPLVRGLLSTGATKAEVALRLGVSFSTLARFLLSLGLTPRRRTHDTLKLKGLVDDGLTTTEIASVLGLSYHAAYRALGRHGLKAKTRKKPAPDHPWRR